MDFDVKGLKINNMLPQTCKNILVLVVCLQCKVNIVLQSFQNRNHVSIKENMNLHWTKKTKGKQGTLLSHFRSRRHATAFWHLPESPCLSCTHHLSHQHLFSSISLSVSHYPWEKDSDHSHLTLNLYVCIQRSFWGCIFVQGCPINLSASLHNAGRKSQWCHLHMQRNPARQHDLEESYYKWFNNIGIHKTCVIMPDDAVLLKAVAGFVHLKQSRWTLVPGLCNCCWSISKHSSPHLWASRHPWNFSPLYPSRPPAHPKAPLHLLLISRSDTLN